MQKNSVLTSDEKTLILCNTMYAAHQLKIARVLARKTSNKMSSKTHSKIILGAYSLQKKFFYREGLADDSFAGLGFES